MSENTEHLIKVNAQPVAGITKVKVDVGGFTFFSGQSIEKGGDNSAPPPFYYLLGSIASCTCFIVMKFFETRGIPTEKLSIDIDGIMEEPLHHLVKVRINILVPPEFPEKYLVALKKTADKCYVKQSILNTPEFETEAIINRAE